jgi:hypothetical protein
VTRNHGNRTRSVRDALRERGVRFDFFVDSVEGGRTPFDRETAVRRAAKAMQRVARAA